jgi:hypothetical protein
MLTAFLLTACDNAGAKKQSPYVSFNETIILSEAVPKLNGEALPDEMHPFVLPIADKSVCKNEIFLPNVHIVRPGMPNNTDNEPLIPYNNLVNSGGSGLSKVFVNIANKHIGLEKLNGIAKTTLSKLPPNIVSIIEATGIAIVSIYDALQLETVKTANKVVIFTGAQISETERAAIESSFPPDPKPEIATRPEDFSKIVTTTLCSEGKSSESRLDAANSNVVVIYKPILKGKVTNPSIAGICDQHLLSKGVSYLAMSKISSKRELQKENLYNAQLAFDQAISESDKKNGCCALAYMNRGVVRDQLSHHEKALEDFQNAERCAPQDANIRYNEVTHFALQKRTEKAFDLLDAALKLGFDDCTLLQKDEDLRNLKATPETRAEFRRVLEQNKSRCLALMKGL